MKRVTIFSHTPVACFAEREYVCCITYDPIPLCSGPMNICSVGYIISPLACLPRIAHQLRSIGQPGITCGMLWEWAASQATVLLPAYGPEHSSDLPVFQHSEE